MPNTIQASASGAAADGAAAPGWRRLDDVTRWILEKMLWYQLMLFRADKGDDSSPKALQSVIVAL
jgi:hypothetical protein